MEETLNTKFNFVFQLLLCTITSSSAGEKLPLTHIMMEIKTSENLVCIYISCSMSTFIYECIQQITY